VARFEGQSVWKVFQRIRDNELLLPNVQRPLVWDGPQVENLFDSLYRGYPVGTALVWRTRQAVDCRRFVLNFQERMGFYGDPWTVPQDGWKEYVLDGQQRMQAIYIGLGGTFEDKVLHLCVNLSADGPDLAPRFLLLKPGQVAKAEVAAWPLREVLGANAPPYELATCLRNAGAGGVPWVHGPDGTADDRHRQQLTAIFWQCTRRFREEEAVHWFKADEDDNPVFNDFASVVEVFIRVNSGGTKLSRSDLVFTLTKAHWPESALRFESLVSELNKNAELGFDTDELLKAALLLTDQDPNVSPEAFRSRGAVDALRVGWPSIERTLRRTVDFLHTAHIRSTRLLPSLNAVLPIAYYVHHSRTADLGSTEILNMRRWLYRSLLERVFGASAVQQVRQAVDVLRHAKPGEFPYSVLCGRFDLRPGGLDDYRLDIGKRSLRESILPLFLAYMDAGFTQPDLDPLWDGGLPQVDHIIPKSRLQALFDQAGETDSMRWINNIGNYRILGRMKNIDKSNQWLGEAYSDQEFLELCRADLLPDIGVDLRQPISIEDYKQFVTARRQLLLARLNRLFAFSDEGDADVGEAQGAGGR
jgi:hypothetical protein